jgi:hypothetical protein
MTNAKRTATILCGLGAVLLGSPLLARALLAPALLAPAAAAPAPAAPAPAATAPRLLSETGLYAADGTIDPRNLPFVPQYPLWSDGAAKSRWLSLPEGSKIDVADLDAWRFPAGTRLWKELAWGGRKVETRMLWKPSADTWAFAAYVWREDQQDAELAPAEGVPDVLEVAPGRRHSIPSVADCLACHGSSPATVLGFSALQLSHDRDPLAPHAEPLVRGAVTLRGLLESNRLAPPRHDLLDAPPRVRATDPVARAAIGYLSANCGGCHNGRGALARLGFDLLHDAAARGDAPEPALATTLDAPARYDIPGLPRGSSRLLAPGAPERSAILHRMRSRSPSSQMPPLGTTLVDTEAAALIERWVAGLAAKRHGS